MQGEQPWQKKDMLRKRLPFLFLPVFLTWAKLFGSSNTHTHAHTHTPLTPYRAELMQEEMKYHYLRGKHTSVHTHTKPLTHSHAKAHTHTYVRIYIYTSRCLPPQKSELGFAQEYCPNIKGHICLFSHQSHIAVSHGLCVCLPSAPVCSRCMSCCMAVYLRRPCTFSLWQRSCVSQFLWMCPVCV